MASLWRQRVSGEKNGRANKRTYLQALSRGLPVLFRMLIELFVVLEFTVFTFCPRPRVCKTRCAGVTGARNGRDARQRGVARGIQEPVRQLLVVPHEALLYEEAQAHAEGRAVREEPDRELRHDG